MAEPIRIELETAADGRDLIDTLARRGLIGRLLSAGGSWEVEIHSPREETQRLLLDLEPALETWLADRQRASIPLHVGAHGSPWVLTPSQETGEKGGIHGSDRALEPAA